MKTRILALTAALCGLAMVGCATQGKSEPMANNVNCPMSTSTLASPAPVYVSYKGQQVGFCCNGCVTKWGKLTDAEKDAKLAAAMKAK